MITPNPKTSGGARWNYLAAWAWAKKQPGGSDATAQGIRPQAVQERAGARHGRARLAPTTFAQRGIGDVAISWENEAWLATKELGPDKFEIVIPSISILAEPSVAVVDKVVLRRGTRTVAEEYLKYLYTPEGQEIAARNYYRPRNPQVAAKHAGAVPEARARDHQGLRRLGQGAEGTLRRRRRVRPDLCPVMRIEY